MIDLTFVNKDHYSVAGQPLLQAYQAQWRLLVVHPGEGSIRMERLFRHISNDKHRQTYSEISR